jgi:hypothetical protein
MAATESTPVQPGPLHLADRRRDPQQGGSHAPDAGPAASLWAGVARVDITDYEAGPVNDPLYVKALVLKDAVTTVAIVTLDAVALAEIGHIRNDYLATVRTQLQRELQIPPTQVLVNASHCHGVVCTDVAPRTVQAVREARQNLVPVRVGAGSGHEDRIMENRRLRLKNGKEADVRHAYALPPDEDVVGVGPVDPQIGVLRLDREDGRTLAVLYTFACHPIQGVPNGGNTADITGFASTVIEDTLGAGATALFLQGCAGDINPVLYKDVDHPRDAEQFGNMLGLSILHAVRQIQCRDGAGLALIHEVLELPRADLAPTIVALRAEQARLLQSLQGTSLNLKTFLALSAKYSLSPAFPSYYSHRYLHDRALGRDHLDRLDALNRQHLEQYAANIRIMEELTRVQTNLDLLKLHHDQNLAAGKGTLDADVLGLRVGDFVLIAFPGELSVQIGLNVKQASPHALTFVAGYSNGYIYYAPTAEQLQNRGNAQEDSDCLLAPEWQALFEARAGAILAAL